MKSPSKIDRVRISTLPCSVVDIEAQKQRRRKGEHDNVSSRADYSNFPEEVSRLCFELYLRNCWHVFDPFAGWGERAAMAARYGKRYTGIDINPKAIQQAFEVHGVRNILADARTFAVPEFDGCVTSPPYWNLERYCDAGLDAIKSWDQFLIEYTLVLRNAFDAALPGTMFCFLVCDWRNKGVYYDFAYQTQRIFTEMGAVPHDMVVVSRKTISKIKIMIPQAVANSYTVKVHESLLVFRKPGAMLASRPPLPPLPELVP